MKIGKGGLILLLVFAVIFTVSSSYASNFSVANNESYINKDYFSGDFVSGNLKISFDNQTNVNFTSNFNGGVSLLDALESSGYSEGNEYNCVPEGCGKTVDVTGSGLATKEITINENKTYGIKLTGKQLNIRGMSLRIESNDEGSCTNPINVDMLDDGTLDFVNDKYVDIACKSRNYGCFKNTNIEDAQITTAEYCEKISLDAAPAYRIGGNIKKGSSGGDVTMRIYDADSGNKLGECILPAMTSDVQLLSCPAEYSSASKFNAFVCISAASGTDYKIATESDAPCGQIGANPGDDAVADYEVFAQPLKYDMINLTLNESVYAKQNPGGDLIAMLQDYISNTYSKDCPADGCVIPIAISGSGGDATISSIKLTYDATGAIGKTATTIYDVSEDLPKISTSGNVVLDISKMKFVVPETTGANDFTLKLEGNTLLSSTINVTVGFAFDLVPKEAFVGIDNQFLISSAENITNVDWDFGDGSTTDNAGISMEHTYTQSGTYTISIQAKNSGGEISRKTFSITVGNAKDSTAILLARYMPRIANISRQIAMFDPWIQMELNKKINLTEINQSLENIRAQYNSNETISESDYENMVKQLVALNVPNYIITSLSGNTPLSFYYNNIDVKQIEEISKNSSFDPNELKNVIIGWMEGNYNTNVGFQIITEYGDYGKSDLLTLVKTDITPKNPNKEEDYFIMNYPITAIKFKQDYGAKALSAGSYITIPASSGENTYEFSVQGNVQLSDIGMYISPGIDAFSTILTPVKTVSPIGFPLGTFTWIIIGLIIITFAAYIALQEWYKRRYEGYLFKNRDDLYNLINFIANGRKAGLKDKEISDNLKKSGWKAEQIEYSAKKLDGKRTGMYEIPIFRVFEKMKLRKEMEKRQQQNFKNTSAKLGGRIS